MSTERSDGEAQAEVDYDERAALLRAAGYPSLPQPSFRLLSALTHAGLFQAGSVLIGTYAFMALGNLLGMVWRERAATTQDVDIGHGRSVALAVPGTKLNLPSVLDGLRMGYRPVPRLDPRQPSTSFVFRKQELRLVLLTPMRGGQGQPVKIAALGAAAQPLKFLDYLIDVPQPALLVGRRVARVTVPDPARFAVHKLLIAQERPVTEAMKSRKDLQQAADLLSVLADERPGDVAKAWGEAVSRGRNWRKRLKAALSNFDDTLRARLAACRIEDA